MRRAIPVLVALLAGCAAPAPAVVPHQGPRIVSLNPCADAILAEVADPGQIAAFSPENRDPLARSVSDAVAARFASTHGSIEEVVALHPDVVIDGAYAAPSTLAAWRRMGLRLEVMQLDSGVADSLAQVRRIARIAGHPDRGEALVRRIEAALSAAAPPAGAPPVSAVIRVWEGRVAGSDTLVDDVARRTGFATITARAGYGQGTVYPLERLLAAPPRAVIAFGTNRALDHPALDSVPQMARVNLPMTLLYCGGPTIPRLAARLAALRAAVTAGGG